METLVSARTSRSISRFFRFLLPICSMAAATLESRSACSESRLAFKASRLSQMPFSMPSKVVLVR